MPLAHVFGGQNRALGYASPRFVTEPGEIVAEKYELIRIIARGGMGAVYEARNTVTHKACAVKLLQSPDLDPNSNEVKRFVLEWRTSAALESDHIVNVYDAGFDPASGMPYIVMELLRGEDMRSIRERLRAATPELVARIALQVATGLTKAHAQGVIHRDIKPANLFLTQRDSGDYIVKIVDFGIAKVKSAGATSVESITHTGGILGTPLYMSPEQLRGLSEIDGRTDIWSLGVVMFELLSGKVPYYQTAPVVTLVTAIISEARRELRHEAPWVPPELAAIVERAMHRDLTKRFRDAAELKDALFRYVNGKPSITLDMLSSASGAFDADKTVPDSALDQDGLAATRTAVAHSNRSSSTTEKRKLGTVVMAVALVGLIVGVSALFVRKPDAAAMPASAGVASTTLDSVPVLSSASHASAATTASAVTTVAAPPVARPTGADPNLPSAASSASAVPARASKILNRAPQKPKPSDEPSLASTASSKVAPPPVKAPERANPTGLSEDTDEFR